MLSHSALTTKLQFLLPLFPVCLAMCMVSNFLVVWAWDNHSLRWFLSWVHLTTVHNGSDLSCHLVWPFFESRLNCSNFGSEFVCGVFSRWDSLMRHSSDRLLSASSSKSIFVLSEDLMPKNLFVTGTLSLWCREPLLGASFTKLAFSSLLECCKNCEGWSMLVSDVFEISKAKLAARGLIYDWLLYITESNKSSGVMSLAEVPLLGTLICSAWTALPFLSDLSWSVTAILPIIAGSVALGGVWQILWKWVESTVLLSDFNLQSSSWSVTVRSLLKLFLNFTLFWAAIWRYVDCDELPLDTLTGRLLFSPCLTDEALLGFKSFWVSLDLLRTDPGLKILLCTSDVVELVRFGWRLKRSNTSVSNTWTCCQSQ